MGSDGHIRIYDLDKLKTIIPNPMEGYGYKYMLLGREVLVTYSDYNYYLWNCLVCGDPECFNEEHGKLIEQADKSDANLTKDGGNDKWEVWT